MRRNSALLAAPPAGGWRQVAIACRDGSGTLFVDGEVTTWAVPPVKAVTDVTLLETRRVPGNVEGHGGLPGRAAGHGGAAPPGGALPREPRRREQPRRLSRLPSRDPNVCRGDAGVGRRPEMSADAGTIPEVVDLRLRVGIRLEGHRREQLGFSLPVIAPEAHGERDPPPP